MSHHNETKYPADPNTPGNRLLQQPTTYFLTNYSTQIIFTFIVFHFPFTKIPFYITLFKSPLPQTPRPLLFYLFYIFQFYIPQFFCSKALSPSPKPQALCFFISFTFLGFSVQKPSAPSPTPSANSPHSSHRLIILYLLHESAFRLITFLYSMRLQTEPGLKTPL